MFATLSFMLPQNSRESAIESGIARIRRMLAATPLGATYRVDVAEVKPKRSNQQNAYLWGVVYPAVLKHLEGWEAEDVHEYCLGEIFGWETVVGLGRKRIRPVKRSAKLSKTEFVDYVAGIQKLMAEHGIYVPDPEEEEAA